MDEDLKIVLVSELDEEASVQRISAQIPNIEKKVGSRNKIKFPVDVDSVSAQAQVQKVTKQFQQTFAGQKVDVTFNLDESSVKKINSAMKDLGVSHDISSAMTEQLDQMGIQIDKITGRWEKVKNQKEKILSLAIQGTDQYGRTVSYLQTYDEKTQKIKATQTAVTDNLEKQRQIEKQNADRAKRDNDSRLAYANRQLQAVEKLRDSYSDINSTKAITNESNFSVLNTALDIVKSQIEAIRDANGELSAEQKISTDNQVAALRRLITAYQNLESAQDRTSKKTKADDDSRNSFLEQKLNQLVDLQSKIEGWSGNGLVDKKHLEEARSGYSAIEEEITNLINQSGKLESADKDRLNSLVSGLRRTVNEYLYLEDAQDKSAKKAEKENESRVSYLDRQQSLLDNIRTKYADANSSGAIIDSDDLVDVETLYQDIVGQIESLRQSSGKLSVEQKDFLEKQIASLRSLVSVYANLEGAEKRTADQEKRDSDSRLAYLQRQEILLDNIRTKYTDPNATKPIVDPDDLVDFEMQFQSVSEKLANLKKADGDLSEQQKADIKSLIAELERLAKGYQNLEYVATSLRTKTTDDVNAEQVQKLEEYENNLRSSGKLTETFQNRISELREQLKTAFDSSSLTDYLNQFDRLKSEVGAFNSQLAGVNAGFSKMSAMEKSITSIKSKKLYQ